MTFDEDKTPIMIMDPRMEMEALKAQLEILRQERDSFKEGAGLAKMYEATLKLQLGHIVELLSAGVAWRESKGGLLQTERLQKAIDAAQTEEASRKKPCKVHRFVNDVCECGERDD
jgi:hypothetical protein